MFKEALAAEFAPFGVLEAHQLEALEAHYELLMRWNQRLNLTRIVNEDAVVKLHYCESLYLGRFLPAGGLRIVDVGSGAGFPGIPVAILRPEVQVALVEAHQRKCVFLRESVRGLANVRVLGERAELVKERFDWVISRAVQPAEVLRLKLAPEFALLIGDADAAGLGETEALPWGDRRALCHVKQLDAGRAT
jgi:16S rRNA (guanine527-N7)-methyltransferase